MATGVGFAALPVVPVFQGISKDLERQLAGPLAKASKSAGESLEKGVGQGADNAAKAVEKAQYRVLKSTQELEAAESKLTEQKCKAEAANKAVEAAARKREEAESKGAYAIAKAEETLARKRAAAEKAARDVTSAEQGVERAMAESANASKSLEQRQKALADAQDEAADSAKRSMSVMDRFKASAESVGSGLMRAAEGLKVHATVALGAIGGLAANATAYASEAEQSYGAVESIFSDHADTIVAKSKEAATAVGLSGREYRELSSVTGAMLKNMGLPMDEVTAKTQDLVGVAADLSATFGGSTKDAIEAVNALMRGEADPIERYGVSIKKTDVNARLAAEGLDKLEGEALKQAEAQTLLAMLMEQTASAQGQFARETDTAAHKQQVATAKFNDAREAIGTALLPVMSDLAEAAAKVAEKIGEHPRLFLAASGAVVALSGAIVTLGTAGLAISGLTALAEGLGLTLGGLAAAAAPVLGVAAAIGVAAGALTWFFTKTEAGQKIWESLVDAFQSGVEKIKGFFEGLKNAAEDVYNILFKGDFTGSSNLFGLGDESSATVDFLFTVRDVAIGAWDAVKGFGAALWDAGKAAGGAVWDAVRASFEAVSSAVGAAWEVVKSLAGAFWDLAQALAPVVLPVLKLIAGVVGGALYVAFQAVVGAITLAATVMEGLARAFTWVIENAITPLIGAIGDLVGWLADKLGGAISWAIDKFSEFVSWIVDNVPAAWQGIKDGFQQVADVFQSVWESFLKPVFDAFVEGAKLLAQIVLTVLIAPIILAWNGLSTAIQWAWENVIKPAWDAMSAAATWLWQNVLVPAFDGIRLAFQAVGDGIMWVWNNVIKPAWDAISGAANWLWQNVLVPAFDGIKAAFGALGDAIMWVWNNVIKVAWDAVSAAAGWLWNNILAPAFDGIRAAWQAMADGIRWVWDNIIRPAWDAVSAGIHWLWDNAISPVVGWIADKWNWLGDVFNRVKDFVIDTVFGGLGRGLDTVKGWFQTAVDAITRIWDGIKAAAAKPVRFVVDTVYNNGIRKAWNLVAKFTGLDELGEVQLGDLGAYARGGILPGYTPGRDPYTFIEPRTGMRIGLSGGEAIMRPEATRALGTDWVDGVNAAARVGGARGVQKFLGKFAGGGVIGSITEAVNKHFPMMTITSTLRPGDPGWHGQGKAVDFSNGTDSTPQMRAAAQWFYANYGPGLLELIHSPFNNNVKNGGNVGDGFGFYGAGTMNAHRNHVHVAAPGPLGDPTVMVEMLGDAGASPSFSIASMVKGLWDKTIGAIGKWDGPGLIGQLPGAMLSKLAEAAWNTVKEAAEKFAASFGGAGGSAGDAESWREMAMWAMRREGFNADDPAQVNAMLAQIMSESGGNPGIAQQIVDVNGTGESAGVGLLQIIPGTFATYRDPSLPDDRRDPQANMVAALRYYKARYGMDLTSVWGHGHGYANGGVLPGYTPGRDVHQFFSPTGGALALSGGEAIMVPEWVRAVGGPGAVARMNAAASGGRTGSVSGAFAAGGVWGGPDRWARDFNEGVQRLQESARQLSEAAAKIADATTLEGVQARAGAAKFGEVASALGFDGVGKTISGVLGAEKELVDARASHAARLKDISDKERDLEEARRGLADAESAQYDDEQKRSDAITKATEAVAKAEDALAESRKKSAAALDIKIFDIAPQISGMLAQAAQATAAIPPLSAALGGLAMVVGPAGISVGVLIQSVLTAIDIFKTVMGAISDFVSGIFEARSKMFALQAQGLQSQLEWAKMVDDMRQKVVELRVSWVEAQVALRDATWKTRIAQAEVVRAQLQGVKSVAEAEAKLEAERKRVAKAAARDLHDLSLMYDRYRWMEYKGMQDRLDMAVTVTPEILALEAEVNAAKLKALAEQRSASLAALQASWEQQKAALSLQQVQANLALQTQQLALMESRFGGFGQAESLQAMNTAKLYDERSKAQGQIGKSWWRLSYWLTGAGVADAKRIKALDKLIAQREKEGKGAGKPVLGTGAMSFFGYGDSAANAVKNGGYGKAEQAMADFQEKQEIQQIELQKQQLEQQIEQNRLMVEYQKQIGDLTTEIEALKAGSASAQYTADSYREQNPAVKAALEELARFEADRASQYADVSAGRRQVVEITIPQQDTYTREQVESMLNALKKVDSIDARVTVLETPAKPGANQVLQDISRRY